MSGRKGVNMDTNWSRLIVCWLIVVIPVAVLTAIFNLPIFVAIVLGFLAGFVGAMWGLS